MEPGENRHEFFMWRFMEQVRTQNNALCFMGAQPQDSKRRMNAEVSLEKVDDPRLAVKAINVMMVVYGRLPGGLWDLCKSLSDPQEKRDLFLEAFMPDYMIERMLSIKRFDVHGIRLCEKFNRRLPPLPSNLKSIETGPMFDRPLFLPPKIEVVNLGEAFAQRINLPPSMKHLVKHGPWGHPFSDLRVSLTPLPPGLESLTCSDPEILMGVLPKFLKELLILDNRFHAPLQLPEALQKLVILSTSFNRPLRLPSTLQSLYLSSAVFNHPLRLPSTLESLYLTSSTFNHPLDLPATLRSLYLTSAAFTHPLELPAGLKELYLPFNYNHPIDMPAGLEVAKLYLHRNYSHPVHLPSGLKELYLEVNTPVVLGPRLVKATFGVQFDQPLVIPPTMKELWIRNPTYSHKIVLPPGCRLSARSPTEMFARPSSRYRYKCGLYVYIYKLS